MSKSKKLKLEPEAAESEAEMSLDEKLNIVKAILKMPGNKLHEVVNIVTHLESSESEGDDDDYDEEEEEEFVIDFNRLKQSTLRELKAYLDKNVTLDSNEGGVKGTKQPEERSANQDDKKE